MKTLTKITKQKAIHLLSHPFKSFSVTKRIRDKFIQEVEHERKEYKAISKEEKIAFYKNTGFKLIDTKDTRRLYLHKIHNDFQVKICFFSKPPINELQETSFINAEVKSEKIEYKVIFNKLGNSGGFIVDAYSNEGTITINNLYFNDDIQTFFIKLISGTTDPDVYIGPTYSALDNKIQKAVHDLLIEFGINEECANFIEVASIDKDQNMFINWLSQAKKCLY